MITSFSLKNFKSYREAEMPLATLTLFIGPNASGKSNALEAIRLLSLLSKGARLDDIEKGIHGPGGYLRGESTNLFRDAEQALEIGCRMEGILWDWNRLNIYISLISDHLVITDEIVSKDAKLDPLFLYRVDGPAKNAISDEVILVRYYNFSEGEMPQIPCSNRQAIFFQLETPGRFREEDPESQFVIPSVAKSIRTNLRNVVFLEPRPEKMRGYSYLKDDVMMEDGRNLSSVCIRFVMVKIFMKGIKCLNSFAPFLNRISLRFDLSRQKGMMSWSGWLSPSVARRAFLTLQSSLTAHYGSWRSGRRCSRPPRGHWLSSRR